MSAIVISDGHAVSKAEQGARTVILARRSVIAAKVLAIRYSAMLSLVYLALTVNYWWHWLWFYDIVTRGIC